MFGNMFWKVFFSLKVQKVVRNWNSRNWELSYIALQEVLKWDSVCTPPPSPPPKKKKIRRLCRAVYRSADFVNIFACIWYSEWNLDKFADFAIVVDCAFIPILGSDFEDGVLWRSGRGSQHLSEMFCPVFVKVHNYLCHTFCEIETHQGCGTYKCRWWIYAFVTAPLWQHLIC